MLYDNGYEFESHVISLVSKTNVNEYGCEIPFESHVISLVSKTMALQ